MIRSNLMAGNDLHDFNATGSATGANALTVTASGSSDYDYLLVRISSSVIGGASYDQAFYVVDKTNTVNGVLYMNDGSSQAFAISRSGNDIQVTGTLAGKMIKAVYGTNDSLFNL